MALSDHRDVLEDGLAEGQRELRLQDLFLTMSAISSVSSLHELLPHLARIVAGSVGAHRCSVYFYDPELTAVIGHVSWGYDEADSIILDSTDLEAGPLEIPSERHVIETCSVLQRIPGQVDDALLPTNIEWRETRWNGDMVVPLIWNDHVEGVAFIDLPDGLESFTPLQEEIALGVAQQAAGIVNHLRSLEAEKQARAQTEMLLELSRVFNSAGSTTEIYSALAEAVRSVLSTDAVSIVARNFVGQHDAQDSLCRVASLGMTDDEKRVREQILASHTALGSTIDRIAGEQRDAVVIDALDDAVDNEQLRESFRRHDVSEVLAAPIIISDELHGVLYSWSRGSKAGINRGLLPIVSTMTWHAAASIERLLLIEMERQQRNRAETLLAFSRLLNRSADLSAVRSAITETVTNLLPGVRTALAMERDERDRDYEIVPALEIVDAERLHSLLDSVRDQEISQAAEIDSQSIVAFPLTADTDLPGILIVARDGQSTFSVDEHALLAALAPQAANAMRRARLFEVAERHVAELTLLQEVGRTIAARRSMPEIFDYISQEVRKLVDYSVGIIALEGNDSSYLEVGSVWGDLSMENAVARIPIDESIMGAVYRSHKPVMVDDVATHPGAWLKQRAVWRSLVCVPLMAGNQAIGALLLGHRSAGGFSEEDVRLASLLAGQAGAAIYQAREAERQRELYRAGVEALAAAVDAKDSYIHSHSRLVADLSRRTATAIGLSMAEVERIELAGLLHDVGKIGIPDHILTKPGRLDPQERLIMIGHAALGARIIAAHPSLARMATLVLHHHEWHNGSGYPDGLRGDEVPLGSAIIAVADAFDSMTSYRPYRQPLSYDAAREELTRWSGTQFNPQVVEAFLTVIEDDHRTGHSGLSDPSMKLEPIQALDVIAPKILSQIATEISHLTDLYPFLNRVQQIIGEEMKYDDVHILLLDEAEDLLVLAASTNQQDLVGRYRVRFDEGLTGVAFQTGLVVNCGDLREDPRATPTDLGTRSLLVVPLLVDDEVIGVLGSGSAEPERFDNRDVTLMIAIAGQIAPTIRVAQLHDHAKRAATTDGLTGVMNHRAFYQRLEDMIAGLEHWNAGLHLLIVDVIGLKAVNDVHGHLAGDRALKAVANALKSRIRSEDEIARYGGDEFVVIVRGTPRAGLEDLAARIAAPVEFTLEDDRVMTVRLRLGAASAHSALERATELVARADAELYNEVSPTERTYEQ